MNGIRTRYERSSLETDNRRRAINGLPKRVDARATQPMNKSHRFLNVCSISLTSSSVSICRNKANSRTFSLDTLISDSDVRLLWPLTVTLQHRRHNREF